MQYNAPQRTVFKKLLRGIDEQLSSDKNTANICKSQPGSANNL